MANRKTANPNNYGSASLLRYVERSIVSKNSMKNNFN